MKILTEVGDRERGFRAALKLANKENVGDKEVGGSWGQWSRFQVSGFSKCLGQGRRHVSHLFSDLYAHIGGLPSIVLVY